MLLFFGNPPTLLTIEHLFNYNIVEQSFNYTGEYTMPKNRYVCDCLSIHTELVDYLSEKMPDGDTFSRIAEFYKILGDPTRCKIIFALLDHEICVCDIANILCMSKSLISHQLSKMKDSGIVKCRRDGKSVYYSLDDRHVADIFTVTMEHVGHMEEDL